MTQNTTANDDYFSPYPFLWGRAQARGGELLLVLLIGVVGGIGLVRSIGLRGDL